MKWPTKSKYRDGYDHRGEGESNAVYNGCEGTGTDPLEWFPSESVWPYLTSETRNKIKRKGVCSWCGRTLTIKKGQRVIPRHKARRAEEDAGEGI